MIYYTASENFYIGYSADPEFSGIIYGIPTGIVGSREITENISTMLAEPLTKEHEDCAYFVVSVKDTPFQDEHLFVDINHVSLTECLKCCITNALALLPQRGIYITSADDTWMDALLIVESIRFRNCDNHDKECVELELSFAQGVELVVTK